MATEPKGGDPDDIRYLQGVLAASPILAPILERWHEIDLPDCWLVAGAVAQTVWNAKLGFPAGHGLRDIDLVYFDAEDLTAETEQAAQTRVAKLFTGLQVKLDVKNEARVHLWYEARFGFAISPYRSVRHAITTFPTTAAAVGVRPGAIGLEVSAPYGLADLMSLIVRPNKVQITQPIYEAKVSRWRTLWPELDYRPWDEGDY